MDTKVVANIYNCRLRGTIVSVNTFTPNAGYLYGLMIGTLVPINIMPWAIVVPSIVFLLLSWCMVESPVWLMKQGRSAESGAVLAWLRGSEYPIEPELKELESLVSDSAEDNVISRGNLLSKSFLFPLFILSTMFFFHASVGADDLSYYALTIFKYPGVSISPNLIAMLFQLSFTIGLMVAPFIMHRVNRKPQFISGGVGLAICMLLIGCYHSFDLASVSFIPAITPVVLHLIAGLIFGTGFGPVPYTLTGELFPQHLKSVGCGIAIAVRYVGQFAQLKLFVLCKDFIGMEGVYFLHCACALFISVFVFILLPETRNKTYTELDLIFRKQKKQEPVDIEKMPCN